MKLSKFDMKASFYEMCKTNFNYMVTLKYKRARDKKHVIIRTGSKVQDYALRESFVWI